MSDADPKNRLDIAQSRDQAVAERLRDTGRYGNISDVMRAALRLLEERELDFQVYRDARLAAVEQEAARA